MNPTNAIYIAILLVFLVILGQILKPKVLEKLDNRSAISKVIAKECNCPNYDKKLGDIQTQIDAIDKKINDAVSQTNDIVNQATASVSATTNS